MTSTETVPACLGALHCHIIPTEIVSYFSIVVLLHYHIRGRLWSIFITAQHYLWNGFSVEFIWESTLFRGLHLWQRFCLGNLFEIVCYFNDYWSKLNITCWFNRIHRLPVLMMKIQNTILMYRKVSAFQVTVRFHLAWSTLVDLFQPWFLLWFLKKYFPS